jgi:hypothetical protein
MQHEHTDRAGSPTIMPNPFDLADQMIDILPFACTDFGQRLPKLRLQAHAGAPTARDYIPVDQSTARHGCPLCNCPTENHAQTKKWLSIRWAMAPP